jgi:hypothetical protein
MSEPDLVDLRPWAALSAEDQLRLREAYGHYLDSLPPTCDLRTKEQRFREWLKGQGVEWRPG